MKNNSGFSLVELIVVIAIMAILAGVAVPTYTKYIAKANDAALLTQLDEVKTAAIAYAATEGKTIEKIVVTDAGEKIEVYEKSTDTTALFDTDEVQKFLDKTFTIDFSNTSFTTTATWTGGDWE